MYGVKETRKSLGDTTRARARLRAEDVRLAVAEERGRGMNLGDGNRWVSYEDTEETPEWANDDRSRDLTEIFPG